MKIKLGTLLKSANTLRVLNNTPGMKTVPAYRISKTVKAVQKEINEFENHRKKLCEEYTNKDEKGKPIIKNDVYDIPSDKLSIINEELANLREETVNIDVKKVDLEDIDKAGLTPAQLESIEFMLKEEK